MVNNSVVIPVAVLAALVVCCFVFVWWYFPRTWRKGTTNEILAMDHVDAEGRGTDGMTREERLAWARDVIANTTIGDDRKEMLRKKQEKKDKKNGVVLPTHTTDVSTEANPNPETPPPGIDSGPPMFPPPLYHPSVGRPGS